jgi:tripartite ATP-independent transporter DctP family solute receptor
MLKSSKKLLLVTLLIFVLVQAPLIMAAKKPTAQNPIICKIGYTEPPTVKIGGKEVNNPGWAQMVAFQSAMEKYSQGRVKVELYPNGRLGDNKSCIEQVMNQNILVTSTTDMVLAPFYKQIQVLTAPYSYKDFPTLWKVLDGPFAKKLFNDMAAKSGLRVLSTGNAGGFMCWANRKKEMRVPADMRGLKMRVPDTPIYLEVVKACGGSPCPTAWMELYSALQTGVVDGMQHAPAVILSSSLYEVQKYLTLTRHGVCIQLLVTNERFFKSLPPDLRKAFLKAGQEGSLAIRQCSSEVDDLALQFLKTTGGMKVYDPTPAEKKLWEKTRGPVIEWLKKNVGLKIVNEFQKAVD